jgi:hypothetical protein
MKRLLVIAMVLMPFSQASGASIGVPSNPLWTNTGISVLATDTVSFTGATAAWTFQGLPLFGPEGSFQALFAFDEWITNLQHGQLIGFIGNAALDLNEFPRVIAQDVPGLFEIGAGPITATGRTGTLWLGFNDGYVTGTSDNEGSGSVDVSLNNSNNLNPVPEPATLLLLATSLAGIGAFARHRRKS